MNGHPVYVVFSLRFVFNCITPFPEAYLVWNYVVSSLNATGHVLPHVSLTGLLVPLLTQVYCTLPHGIYLV